MRVCHITSVHPRHDVRICEKECVSLVNQGYETYLVVNDDKEDEDYKGIHIISTGNVRGGRLERMLYAPQKVLKKALETRSAIYHLHDPELLSIAGKLLRTGSRVIFDMHEDTEKQILTKTWIPGFLRRTISFAYGLYSRRRIKKLSGLISVTPAIVEKYARYNPRTVLVTNYPIIVGYDEKSESTVKKHRFEEEPYVFFAGGITEQWSHETIVSAVKMLSGVKYKFAGLGNRDYITKLEKAGNGCVEYIGTLPHDEVIKYYHGAIAGMALLSLDTQVGKKGTLGNTKLFEIMQSERPVICSNLELWEEIVERNHCGICVNPNDSEELSQAIKNFVDNPDQINFMGKNGAKMIAEEFNWNTQSHVLFDLYDKIAKIQ